MEYDGFTIVVDEDNYRFSHDMDEADYKNLKGAIEHITSDIVDVKLEESY
jgi:hypothetical protein